MKIKIVEICKYCGGSGLCPHTEFKILKGGKNFNIEQKKCPSCGGLKKYEYIKDVISVNIVQEIEIIGDKND